MSSMSSPAPPRPSRPQQQQQQPNPSTTEDHYFSSNPPPAALAAHVAQAKAFIDAHARAQRRVVLVTSGGTTVPLERQTVRYIDNFSAGTRGATSAEYFLETGAYAVIFLHRQFSLLPYSRHYTHATDCFLDFLHEAAAPPGTGIATSPDGKEGTTTGGSIVVAKDEYRDKMLRVLRKYRQARDDNLLLMIPFVTITDYLHELRALARLMQPLGGDALLYLAAAVSDFFVPPERMAEHKIQSTDAADAISKVKSQTPGSSSSSNNNNNNIEASTSRTKSPSSDLEGEETFDNFDSSPLVPRSKRLVIDLDPVPKFLKNLVDGWAPGACIVSFKLETDPAILVHKARYSLDRYQHHLVIGNLLATRKWEVVFVSPGLPDRWIRVPLGRRKKSSAGQEHLVGAADRGWNAAAAAAGAGEGDRPLDPSTLPEGEPEMEIESLIIGAVEDLHSRHINAFKERVSG